MSFDILSRNTHLGESLLLEASAGSGKTFSIENMVVRLIAVDKLELNAIVVSTFTKAAASDLRARVRENIARAMRDLRKKESAYDYLNALIENGESEPAARRLEKAYFCFDEAPITTLHSFAARILQENCYETDPFFTEIGDHSLLEPFVEDFLRGGLSVSKDELAKLLKKYKFQELKDKLIKECLKGKRIEPEEGDDPLLIYSRVAHDCSEACQKYKRKNDIFFFDDLLKEFHKRLSDAEFLEKMRSKYKAAIIDEFQDTDHVQWEIFAKIFLSEDHRLFLVGDPKQSIYAFRDADIYTYIAAKNAVKTHATLTTNFRSHPALVEGMNTLFTPSFLPLPRLGENLPVYKMNASSKTFPEWEDGKQAIHFFGLKEGKTNKNELFENLILPYLIKEIKTLKVPLSEIAILVDTHEEARKIYEGLSLHNIPAALRRSPPLKDSEGMKALADVIDAAWSPKNFSLLKTALGGPLIGWTVEDFALLEDLNVREKYVFAFLQLRQALERGTVSFIKAFLESTLRADNHTVLEWLLMEKSGMEALRECDMAGMRLGDRVVTGQEFLRSLDEESEERDLLSGQGVQILTLHVSKGLEFDVVFAVGLANRKIFYEDLRSVDGVLRPIHKTHPDFDSHVKESDAEKLRLLYVALTRAKRRLYIPMPRPGRKASKGQASPLELFWEAKKTGPESLEGPFSVEYFEASSEISDKVQIPCRLEPPPGAYLHFPERYIGSFTSLKRKEEAFKILTPAQDDLPLGAETGIALHALLEKIPFTASYDDILDFCSQSPLSSFKEKCADMIFKAFNTPLGSGFCLRDVTQAFRECEFLYPTPHGYITGYIDLLFKHDGRYYLVDWKSNFLSDYSRDALSAVMREEEYTFQAELYKEALMRFTNIHEKEKDVFGGIYFYFLRGGSLWTLPS